MNIRQKLLAGITIMLLAIGNTYAADHRGENESREHRGHSDSHESIAHAPEINAASGSNAIALLVGGLLLVGEKYRSRHS
jgi:hypothetical protein